MPNTIAGAPPKPLTPRQRDVLNLLAKGLTNDEIGRELGLETTTVKVHVRALIAHFNANNRTHVIARAYDRGELTPTKK